MTSSDIEHLTETIDLVAFAADEPFRHAPNADGQPTYADMLAALRAIQFTLAEL